MAEGFLKMGTPWTWTATLRADQGVRLEHHEFELLKRSGLRQVMVGVESGDPITLQQMQKDITLEQVEWVAARLKEHRIHGIFPFIVGLPNEEGRALSATLKMAHRLRRMSSLFDTPIFFYKPYPGSPLAREAVRSGYPLPRSLDEWAQFDFIASAGPWVERKQRNQIERFKFYNRLSGGQPRWYKRPFQWLARRRCETFSFSFPIEKFLIETVRPQGRLS